MGQDVIARRHIDNPGTRLKAFGDDQRLDLVRPPPLAPSLRLHKLAAARRPFATIRQTIPPSVLGGLPAGASCLRNTANQWAGTAACD
jgi:hypothetical protein